MLGAEPDQQIELGRPRVGQAAGLLGHVPNVLAHQPQLLERVVVGEVVDDRGESKDRPEPALREISFLDGIPPRTAAIDSRGIVLDRRVDLDLMAAAG